MWRSSDPLRPGRRLALRWCAWAALALAAPLARGGEEPPGFDGEALRFATVIAPGVDAVRRQAMVDMLESAFAQKNARTGKGRQGVRGRPLAAAAPPAIERKWQLDVWELQGAPETWRAQLDGHYRRTPVFALVSGLSDTTWQPVHDFCEAQGLPCWFPSVALPDARAGDFYSIYFSRGVTLEADVLASHLLGGRGERPSRLVQIHADDAVGRGAAAALKQALAGSSLALETRSWTPGDQRGLTRALRGIGAEDAAMLWVARDDLRLLAELPPPRAQTLYLSAQLAAGEKGLPAAWKRRARLVYPFALPQERAQSAQQLRAWLAISKLPLVDELMQSQVHLAVGLLADALGGLAGDVQGARLLERAEALMGRREDAKAAGRRDRSLATRVGLIREERALPAGRSAATLYPRLEVAPGQRFASRGAYIVRFPDAHGDAVVAESGWIVP